MYTNLQQLQSDKDELVKISKEQLEQLMMEIQKPKQLPPPPPMKKSSKKIVIKQNPKKQKSYQFADVTHWTTTNFDWDRKVFETLQKIFGKENFKVNQKAIINCVLAGKDVFVCMPTGYGKSITFQIPAYVEEGLSIVVMPLIALIYDQVQYLESLGVKTLNISGQNKVYNADEIIKMNIKLIYTTPEKIEKSDYFRSILNNLYAKKYIKRFVIDEAHCVSKWGRDFRPDYLKLGKVRVEYPHVPIVALTATAPEEVKEDIIDVLGIKGCLYLQSSFNRPNLIYEVRPREKQEKTIQEIKEFINFTYPKQSGIIYCLTQHECESVSQALKRMGIDSNYYHAGLPEQERNKIHKDWLMNEVQVIVATIAFGMGIDKKDCRFVIHYQMPKSIENYYQESGRAGRDGKPAHCILLYNNQDYKTQLILMDGTDLSPQIKKYNIKKLEQMQAFCYDREQCRRVLQLSYLGETFNKEQCQKKCDNCQRDDSSAEKFDLTKEALKILDSLLSFPLTETQLINCLKGINAKKLNNFQSNDAIFGMFKQNQKQIMPLIEELRSQQLLGQKVQVRSFGQKKFTQKIVYLTTTQNNINSVKSIIIKIFKEKDKKSSVIDEKAQNLFKKYLSKENNNNSNIQQQQQQQQQQQWIWRNTTQPEQIKKLQYDQQYGYCLEDQFNDLKDRLMLVRKQIYKATTNNTDQIVNIDHILSTDDIEEICKKLPTTMQELNDPFIRIAQKIKMLPYMQQFIFEVQHFVEIEQIDKSKFEKIEQQEEVINQVFEFQNHIVEEDDVVDITHKQQDIQRILEEGQDYDQLDQLLGWMYNSEDNDEIKKTNQEYQIIDDSDDLLDLQMQQAKISTNTIQSEPNLSIPQIQSQTGEKKKLKISLKSNKRKFL